MEGRASKAENTIPDGKENGQRAEKRPAWSIFAVASIFFTLAAAGMRLKIGPSADALLVASAGVAVLLLAARVLRDALRPAPAKEESAPQLLDFAALEQLAPPLEQIEQMQALRELFINAVADGICGTDPEGRLSYINPAAARLLEATPNAVLGRSLHEILHGSAPAKRRCGEDCPLARATTSQLAAAGEDIFYRADGYCFHAEYVLTPVRVPGRAPSLLLSFRDISQRFAVDRVKDEFISTVSHELRTPLTSIRGALGLLSSGMLGEVNEKAANLLRIALTNSDRLVRLINDILDLERIQSGREPLSFESVQLGDLVHQAMDGMLPVAEAASVQLLHDSTQTYVEADADRLLQVLTNLLSNAVKFSSPGGTVSVTLKAGEEGVTLSVIDQGRGIPADKLEMVFGRFQQVDASDARQKGGSGLGLAICRSIVHQHNGRIWAERNTVRGATFRVFLPYTHAALAAPAEAQSQVTTNCCED